jgi:transposase InsO family protein
VSGETKEQVLKLIDTAVGAGAPHAWACRLLGVSDDRVHRWRIRLRTVGTLEDRAPGGVALHAVTPAEIDAVLAVAEEWGEVDRSHRKLAHRGSYVGQVWVSPSTFRRVLAAHGLVLPAPPVRDPTPKPGWPDWLEWAPNRIWCWDATHFPRARRVAFAIIDVVSRRWIDTLVSVEETSTQVQVLFDQALIAEGLADLLTPERLELDRDDPARPILLACSDNGPQMTSHATREFLAGLAIAQRLGRPHTPADQAWIESLFGHVKAEWPHLEQLGDPAVLDSELDRVRGIYNSTRLHAGIGYVTPNDEHHGRGEQIRQARLDGLRRAHDQRVTYHRRNRNHHHPGAPA